MHPATLPDEDLLAQCEVGRSRAGGPGGQHRNKVETAVVITHKETGISGQASERRSQIDNKRVALRRLRLNLATKHRTSPPAPTGIDWMDKDEPDPNRARQEAASHKGPQDSADNAATFPSPLWRSRRQGTKIVCSPNHRDFPSLLAEALDVIASEKWEPKPAATRLGVSTSQLIKFVKDHPLAFQQWNNERAKAAVTRSNSSRPYDALVSEQPEQNGDRPRRLDDPPPPWGSESQADRLARLLEKARALPRAPGVYLMQGHKGVVLYIGKALKLRERVSSYFIPSADLGPRKQPMLDHVHDFEFLPCESEWEAVLTEARLVKDTHPRFNSMLKDDKTWPYLAITLRDDFPGVYVTRAPNDPRFRGARILGPFSTPGALREALELLQKVFKYRTCELDIREDDDQRRFFRPCLLHAIGQCTAPCAAKISKDAYRDDINRFVRFLDSKRSVMLREMRAEMQAASKAQEFEKAATLRDQIRAVEKLDERAHRRDKWQPEAESFYVDPVRGTRSLQRTLGLDKPIRCIEAIDIAHLAGGETVGSKVCFIDGKPLKGQYRRYRITTVDNDDYAAIREVVSRRYRDAGAGQELYPDVILIDGGLGQLHAAQQAFAQLEVKPPMVISLAKKEELIYVQEKSEPIRLGRENLGLKLCQAIRDEAHRFAQHYHHILRRKKTVGE